MVQRARSSERSLGVTVGPGRLHVVCLGLHSPGAEENPIPERERARAARGAASHLSLGGSASYSLRRPGGSRPTVENIARAGPPQGIVGWGGEGAASACSFWAFLSSATGLCSVGIRRTSERPSLLGWVELAYASPAGQGFQVAYQ